MNQYLNELYCRFKHLRTMQEIVEEIEILDNLAENYDEDDAIVAIDHCVKKYDNYISRIGSLYQSKVVVHNDAELYDDKDDVEIHGDVEFIRDCLVIIGAVLSGIRPSLEYVVKEMRGEL